MDTSRDPAFQLRMGAPEDMLVTFDGLKRPVGVALQAIFAARHAASTKYWADVVNNTCHTIDDLRAVMARRVPPPTADYYVGAADREITLGENERAFRAARFKPRMGLNLDAQFIILCSASTLAEKLTIFSPSQSLSPAKTRTSSRLSRVRGHHHRPSTNCSVREPSIRIWTI